jgi:hypothetical protein
LVLAVQLEAITQYQELPVQILFSQQLRQMAVAQVRPLILDQHIQEEAVVLEPVVVMAEVLEGLETLLLQARHKETTEVLLVLEALVLVVAAVLLLLVRQVAELARILAVVAAQEQRLLLPAPLFITLVAEVEVVMTQELLAHLVALEAVVMAEMVLVVQMLMQLLEPQTRVAAVVVAETLMWPVLEVLEL